MDTLSLSFLLAYRNVGKYIDCIRFDVCIIQSDHSTLPDFHNTALHVSGESLHAHMQYHEACSKGHKKTSQFIFDQVNMNISHST
jgi:hypothetical protein